jgi:hypothetical protein
MADTLVNNQSWFSFSALMKAVFGVVIFAAVFGGTWAGNDIIQHLPGRFDRAFYAQGTVVQPGYDYLCEARYELGGKPYLCTSSQFWTSALSESIAALVVFIPSVLTRWPALYLIPFTIFVGLYLLFRYLA